MAAGPQARRPEGPLSCPPAGRLWLRALDKTREVRDKGRL